MNWRPLPLPPCRLGESPMWHPVTNQLYWCDIPAGTLHRSDADGRDHRQWAFGTDVACCAPVDDGTLVLGLRSAIVHFDPVDGSVTPLVDAPYDTSRERFNDGKVDPAGRLWVGTIYEPRQPPLAALYRLEWDAAGARLTRQAEGMTVSNGLAFSPDGATIYRSDTTSHTLWKASFDADAGTAGPWTVWAQRPLRQPDQPLSAYGGRPDGAAVDEAGCYWAAMYEGRCLVRYAPDGRELEVIELPVTCPTMPCFGGPDRRTLFVTTARQQRPETELQAQPWSGAVLQARVDVPGLPLHLMRRPPAGR